MKKLLLAGATMALLTSAALAQTDAPPPPPPGVPSPDAPPPPPPGSGVMREPHGPRGREASGPPPPPSKAAHFRLKSGDVDVDVKCADDETMKACADIATQLMDKLGTLKQ